MPMSGHQDTVVSDGPISPYERVPAKRVCSTPGLPLGLPLVVALQV